LTLGRKQAIHRVLVGVRVDCEEMLLVLLEKWSWRDRLWAWGMFVHTETFGCKELFQGMVERKSSYD